MEFMDLVGARGGLDAFLIRQSPRFDEECLEKLVLRNPDLKELRLSEVEKRKAFVLTAFQAPRLTDSFAWLPTSERNLA